MIGIAGCIGLAIVIMIALLMGMLEIQIRWIMYKKGVSKREQHRIIGEMYYYTYLLIGVFALMTVLGGLLDS